MSLPQALPKQKCQPILALTPSQHISTLSRTHLKSSLLPVKSPIHGPRSSNCRYVAPAATRSFISLLKMGASAKLSSFGVL